MRPQPGMTPTRACVSAKRARSDAMMKSQLSATSKPPVTATPLTAPISGLVCGGNAPRNESRVSPTSANPSPCCTWPEPNSFRSTPAENAGSAPVRIMTSTSSSVSQRVIAAGSVAPHVAVQRVALIGAVDRDDRDPVGDVDENDRTSRLRLAAHHALR